MKKKPCCLFICVLLVLSLSACTPEAYSTILGSGIQEPAPFADNFSQPPSGWGIKKQDGGIVEYLDGGLRFLVNEAGSDLWSVAGKKFSDVQIEVDVQKRSGPENNHFGIICRYVNKYNFYMLVASSDSYYGIAKLKDGKYSMIGMEQLQYSEVILPGRATNHLRADCVGNSLSLHINGLELVEVLDVDFDRGDVGLIAGTYGEKGVEIIFDQFLAKPPDD